jgi:cbb3-type cytochrome oxidase subunit 1
VTQLWFAAIFCGFSQNKEFMEISDLISGLLFFAWILFLPQFLGILVHYRLKKFPELAYIVGFLLTTILSFYLLIAVFMPKVEQNESMCGGAAITVIFVVFFTFLQIIGSLFAQLWMKSRMTLKSEKIN